MKRTLFNYMKAQNFISLQNTRKSFVFCFLRARKAGGELSVTQKLLFNQHQYNQGGIYAALIK